MFERILGNAPLKAYLARALEENRLPQTLLFSGPEGVGKSLFAKELAARLLATDFGRIERENHPDFHVARPEGKSGLISIDSLRALIDRSHAAPFEAEAKVFLIESAERMQPAAANAMLKTLEEPTQDTTWILLTHAPQELLPTILSRCVALAFQPLKEEEIALLLQQKGHPSHFAKHAAGSAGKAFEMASNPQIERLRELLFPLLREPRSYPDLSRQAAAMEEVFDAEEDPLRASRLADALFAAVLMWFRDQHLRKLNGDPRFLYFPEEALCNRSLLALKQVEEAIQEVRQALQRNIKFSTCLTNLLLRTGS